MTKRMIKINRLQKTLSWNNTTHAHTLHNSIIQSYSKNEHTVHHYKIQPQRQCNYYVKHKLPVSIQLWLRSQYLLFCSTFHEILKIRQDFVSCITITHTHTHTCTNPFDGPFSETIQVSWYQKGKSILILLKQETVSSSGISWAICKSAPCSRQITMPAPQHSVFYRLDACHPTNSIEALKALESSNCNSQFTLSKVHTFKKFLT